VSDQPRLLLLSQRGLAPHVSRCCSYEFEDLIRSVDAADLIAPHYRQDAFELLSRAVNKLGRRIGLLKGINPGIRPVRVEHDYQLFFAVFQFATDALSLNALRGWREHCEVAACWLEEIWARDLHRLQSQIGLLRQFDYIFTNCLSSLDGLAKASGRPVIYKPPGVDCLRFIPGDPPPERVIDIFNMGRRHPDTHRALLDRAEERRLFYLYDTFKGNVPVQEPAEHRLQLANLIKRTRFFMANKPKANEEGETARQEELGFRFFEGAAGGAVMIGDPPDVASFREHFDWPDAVVPLPFGSRDVGDLIADLQGQTERLARIREANVRNALLRHDWAYRWRAVLELTGLDQLPSLQARLALLSERADQLPHAYGTE
jgi:hypothetical protein